MVEKKKIPRPSLLAHGDHLIGLPSSGLHSNGFSLARRILLDDKGFRLGDKIAELGRSLGEELLEPTVISSKVIRTVLKHHSLKGIAHITGGGISGNLSRILPSGKRAWIDRNSWSRPAIFDLIRRSGNLTQGEMDRTFNNGLGMILIVGKRDLGGVERTLKRMGERFFLIGEIKSGGKGVNLVS